jgi:predicted transposase YbfD/YdcC
LYSILDCASHFIVHWKFREAKEEADADYVLPLKGNQQKMHAEAKIFLDETVTESSKPRPVGAKLSPATVTLAVLETLEKDHGRIETRRYFQSAQVDWCADRAKWEGLQSVGIVGARRKVGGQWTVERRYYLTSLPLDVETFARAVRGHWGVENKLHWVLDVCLWEDQSRAGYAAENLATLRRLALNLLRREKTKQSGTKNKQLSLDLANQNVREKRFSQDPHYANRLLRLKLRTK